MSSSHGSPPSHGSSRMSAAQLPTPGHVIAGKYVIEKAVGEGGMGIVYEATHLRLRQRVAVKMLLPDMLPHQVIVTRFEREARAAAQLRSRHVARVMDVDVTPEGLPYMVMEFLEGHDLQSELDRRGRIPWNEVVDHVLQACAAMIEAHQLGIIHRDLKPSNLFLARDGDTRVLKVLDFGISKVQSERDEKLTSAEAVMGTAMYMAPEQVRSSQNVDGRADIWSLGVILYELLAGRPPFVGTPTQVAAAIVTDDPPDLRGACDAPQELLAIVTKALQRDPAARYQDVRALALALAPLASGAGAGGADVRVSRPRIEQADTIVQASAVSEARLRGRSEGGTAPGWSQHSPAGTRNRTLVIGFTVAFVAATLLIGGGALLLLRGRDPSASTPAARSASANARPSDPAGDPPPPSIEPPPPLTGQPAEAPLPASASAARPTASAPRPARPSSEKPARPSAPPPAAPKTAPAAGSANPLLL